MVYSLYNINAMIVSTELEKNSLNICVFGLIFMYSTGYSCIHVFAYLCMNMILCIRLKIHLYVQKVCQ